MGGSGSSGVLGGPPEESKAGPVPGDASEKFSASLVSGRESWHSFDQGKEDVEGPGV
jgi:hypothetical protein